MTTRNFRVHNGISVGDVVISATTNTITGLSTEAPSADGDVANKKDVDDSVSALSSTTITQGNSNVTVADVGTGSVTITVDGAATMTHAASGITVGNALSMTANDKNVTLSPTGTGTVAISPTGALTINPTAASTINNTSIGATTAAAGTFTQVTVNGANVNTAISPSGTGTVTISPTGGLTLGTGGSTISMLGSLNIAGDITVSGTNFIVNTTTLEIEDNIIGLNRNASGNATIPRFSGLHIHRGDTSDALEQDPYFVWDEAFNEDGSTYGVTNAGGTWTALRSTHNTGTGTPNSDFELVDVRCRIIRAVATSAQYADIAERFAADAVMTPGAVVMFGGAQEITETAEELSEKVFGVVSTQPAYMMNSGAGNNDSHPFVAMTGRTPVRVTGTVNKGDRLVSSSVKGTARAARTGESINPFHVIGRALESKSDAGIGLVNCFVQAKN